MEHIIINSATVSLLLFGIIGIVDGFYYHIWKFKLHKHPETRVEHITHTIRAAIFLALLFLLFLYDFGGTYLLAAVAIVFIDIIVLLVDLITEEDSRKKLGGLPHMEYIVHVIANALHFISVALILVAKPMQSWDIDAPITIMRDYPEFAGLVAYNLIPGVALLVIFHIALMNTKFADLFDSIQDKLIAQFPSLGNK